ncbi:MAG: hypothetical protein GKR96_09030 [Gammaproteobacteria bacterium]|nr:hypothetical protein [Gammaproteobacteria bacterium]
MVFVCCLMIYLLIGVVFAMAFFFGGYQAIHKDATDSSVRVRLLWCPAAVAIWPILVYKWVTGK